MNWGCQALFSSKLYVLPMIHGIWEVFLALLSSEEDSDEEGGEGSFVPSPLDLSVRVGHGGRDDEVVREISKIDKKARELEENRRSN